MYVRFLAIIFLPFFKKKKMAFIFFFFFFFFANYNNLGMRNNRRAGMTSSNRKI